MESFISLILSLIIIGCIIGLLLYLVSISPIPEPFKGWLWFVVVGLAVIAIIFYVLLPMLHGGGVPKLNLGR